MDKHPQRQQTFPMKSACRSLALAFSWLLTVGLSQAHAQQGAAPNDQNPSSGSNLDIFNPLDKSQFWLTAAIIVSGLLFFLGQIMLSRSIKDLTADDIVRNCSITIVI